MEKKTARTRFSTIEVGTIGVALIVFFTVLDHGTPRYFSPEVNFVERSTGGLNIMPASCASSPINYHSTLALTADGHGYTLPSGTSEGGASLEYLSSNTHWLQTTVTPPATWKNVVFDSSTWTAAVDEGAVGISPWLTNFSPWPAGSYARWIWYYNSLSSGDTTTTYFRREFVAPGGSFTVYITADNSYVAYLDGVQIASGNNWQVAQAVTITPTPNVYHVLAIAATNAGGPGGLLVDGGLHYYVCASNTSGTTYFIPTRSPPEVQSFKGLGTSRPGITAY